MARQQNTKQQHWILIENLPRNKKRNSRKCPNRWTCDTEKWLVCTFSIVCNCAEKANLTRSQGNSLRKAETEAAGDDRQLAKITEVSTSNVQDNGIKAYK